MAGLLAVGLASWIIQDGNYGDFACGDRAAFALEFYGSTELDEVKRAPMPSLVSAGGVLYKALGEVVHVSDDWWAIDVGTMIFQEAEPPRNARLGGWMSGEISVGIDPFTYFERLAREPDAPSLIYDWTIEKIEMQTTPSVEVRPHSMARDSGRPRWREIDKTDAWKDNGGLADYILHCRRFDGPARRTRRR
jgi:hypothetical protein